MKLRWLFLFGFFALVTTRALHAADGRIVKVLPLLMDTEGRTSISPSLFDRDAYQADMRRKKIEVAGEMFKVLLKFKVKPSNAAKLKLEARGGSTGEDRTLIAEKKIERWSKMGTWVSIEIGKEDWERLKGVSSWRVSLWEGETLMSEEKSFLW